MAALDELERHYEKAKRDRSFQRRLDELLRTYAGRPTALFFARRLTKELGRRSLAARKFISSAKICSIPARTRSTTAWDKPCWSSAWASIVSSPRLAPGSTA